MVVGGFACVTHKVPTLCATCQLRQGVVTITHTAPGPHHRGEGGTVGVPGVARRTKVTLTFRTPCRDSYPSTFMTRVDAFLVARNVNIATWPAEIRLASRTARRWPVRSGAPTGLALPGEPLQLGRNCEMYRQVPV